MEYLVQFQINLYALIILVILYVTIVTRTRINHVGKQIFKFVIFFAGSGIIIEPLTWIFDGMTFTGAYFLEYSTNFLLILISPIICWFMLSYVDYYILKDKKSLKKRYLYFAPIILTLVLLIINFFYPVYFEIDKVSNSYSTGKFYWIHFAVVAVYYLYMAVFTFIHRKKTYSYAVIIFFVFFSITIMGMVLQLFLSEFFFSWTSIVLSLLVIYIFLESTSSDKDYLTKLYSRQSYERYVAYLIEREKPFSILFIDLDKLKVINDELGHFKGDVVLIEFSRALTKVFSPNHMVSRLGGDEFIVVIENVLVIGDSVTKVYKQLTANEDKAVANLNFSYGYQQYEKNMTIDELYVKADKKMYIHKEKNRKT